jgi:uncharacterized protein YndB with AHSA1/START domain
MVPDSIEREIVIEAPVDRVWNALTRAEHFRHWFAFDGAEIDLRPGGTIIMHWKEHGTYYGIIEQIEPQRLFAFRGAQTAGEAPRVGNSTLVAFTLSPEGPGTRLRVVESGFRSLEGSAKEQAEQVKANTMGWQGAFEALQAYLRRQAA